MVRFIKKIIVFLFVSLLLISGVVVISAYDNVDKQNSTNSNIISLQVKSEFDKLDILFVGNSYCYSGIQTVLLDSVGLESYNLGIATAGLEFYDLIVNDYLDNIEKYPKSIFILVSTMTFSSKSDNFSSYPVHRYLNTPLTNIQLALEYSRIGDLVPMYRKSLMKSLSNIVSHKKSKAVDYNAFKKTKGFVSSKDVVSPEIIENDKYLYQPMLNDEFDANKLSFLYELIESIEDKGINVVFFELPTNMLNTYFNDEYLINYEQALSDIEKKNLLIRFDQDLYAETDYRNIDHLNDNGSRKVTEELIDIINNNKELFGLID